MRPSRPIRHVRTSMRPPPGRPSAATRARAWRSSARVVALAASVLPGCSLMSTLELASLAGQAAHTGLQYVTPARSTNTVHLGAAVPREACIEHNPFVGSPDVLPALLAELGEHGVRIRVLAADAGVPCATWIRYAAVIQWDVPPFEQDQQPYLSQASLSMVTGDGRLLSQSEYRLEGSLPFRKWTSTRSKLQPVVNALLTGVES